jgi:hypothetical protein
VNRFWTLTNGGVTLPAAGFIATFNYINGSPVDFDSIAAPANFIVERWDGTNWFPTTLNATCTATPGTNLCERVNGLTATTFGDFAIGDPIANFNGSPGAFNAFETSAPAGGILGRLYTKLVGTAFTVSIVAVSNNAVNAAPPTTALTVDVIDASPVGGTLTAASNCRTTWVTVIQTQTVPAAVAWASGRVNVIITAPVKAVRNARIRVTQGANVGCSTDNFTIRPTAFTVSSTNAGNTNTTGLPAIKTGANFNLTAASVIGYDGTPVVDNTKILGTPTAGTIGGVFAAASVLTGTATGNAFYYSEVGNVGLSANAVSDAGFTSVDQPNDCVANSTSNSLSGGKYGCSIGSAVVAQTLGSSGFGRFIPENFDVSYNTPVFGTACGIGFTYIGQPFVYTTASVITVTARNGLNNGLTNATTTNYAGAYVKVTNASLTGKSYTAASGGAPIATGVTAPDPAIRFNGDGTLVPPPPAAGFVTLTFNSGTGLFFSRNTPIAPFDADISLAINVVDTDNVQLLGNPARFSAATAGNGIAFSGAKEMRFGRLTLGNAFGSERLDLPIPIETQYYTTGGVYVTNVADSCTSISLSNVSLSSGTATGGGGFASGKGNLKITKPLAKASMDVCVDLDGGTPTDPLCVASTPANKSWLQWKWSGANYDRDPKAMATFGVYKSADEFIYLRENF